MKGVKKTSFGMREPHQEALGELSKLASF
jgi:hypothetical protein